MTTSGVGSTAGVMSAPERRRPGPNFLIGPSFMRPTLGFVDEIWWETDTHLMYYGTDAGWLQFTLTGVVFPLAAPDGSLAAVSYGFAAAPGTGMYRIPGSGALGVAAGGTGAWQWLTSGTYEPTVQDTFDIGELSNRVRNVYIGNSVKLNADVTMAYTQGFGATRAGVVFTDAKGGTYTFGPITDTVAYFRVTAPGGGTYLAFTADPTGPQIVSTHAYITFNNATGTLLFGPKQFYPAEDGTYDLGISTDSWRDIYQLGAVFKAGAAHGTPAAGFGVVYVKSADKKPYYKDDTGAEMPLGGSVVTTFASGTQTAVIGTEHTLASVNVAGVFQGYVDLTNMAAGDIVELRVYKISKTGGTTHVMHVDTYQGAQLADAAVARTDRLSNSLTDTDSLKLTLKQTAGTGRNYDYCVDKS